MKENYSLKQKKIYEEYSLYSSDMLNRMINDKKNHKGDVIRIIADILAERNRGFYAPAVQTPEPEEIKEVNQPVAGEFPEDEESNVVYEEVPWLTNKPVFLPGISGSAGDYVNGSENLPADEAGEEDDYEDEDEIKVKEAQEKYWKCPKCNELVEIEFDVCWNCQSDMPKEILHPNKQEVIKEIRGNARPFNAMNTGLGAILSGGLIFLVDKHRDSFDDDIIRYIFSGFFVAAGLFLIIFSMFRKKDNPE
jgi:rubrerythrin